jgi:DNA polymerase-3 subunit delta'
LRLGHWQLNFLTKEQEAFAQNFSKVINEANIIPIMEEMQLAAAQIEQNANAKIVFFDMILVLNRLLKTKK